MLDIADQKEFLQNRVNLIPDSLPKLNIAQHAEMHRVLPPGTPRPGKLNLGLTPYLYEILENLSPMSPIQHEVLMKGTRIGANTAAESALCYFMGYCPADILFMSATDALLERWVSRNLEAAINSYGYRDIIYAQYTNKKTSRKSGDTTYAKEYHGCRLDMAPAQAAAKLRSVDKRILFRDEIDAAPPKLTTGEGSFIIVSERRLDAWEDRKKIFDFSTPARSPSESAINLLYEEGDMREFLVECPFCHTPQIIDFWRMQPVYRDGEVYDVYMECFNPKCKEKIKNHHKAEMYRKNYRWNPTAKSSNRFLVSRKISSLYSPVGFFSWTSAYQVYLKCEKEGDMTPFYNTILGECYVETGQRPKVDKIINLRGNYISGVVPNYCLYLTFGADVQVGTQNPEDKNPPRLEIEVLGHGENYKTASIKYLRFEGAIDDPFAGAWEKFANFIHEGGLTFKREDGLDMSVEMGLIDSGDGRHAGTVYDFCSGFVNIYPSKGFQALQLRKGERPDAQKDEFTNMVFKRYRYAKLQSGQFIYEISTNYYKRIIYRNLQKQRAAGEDQVFGFCDFPRDYPSTYFEMLTAEEPLKDGSFDAKRRRNESLDCRVMALCAGDAWLDSMVRDLQAQFKMKGYNNFQLQQISHRYVLTILRQELTAKGATLPPVYEKKTT